MVKESYNIFCKILIIKNNFQFLYKFKTFYLQLSLKHNVHMINKSNYHLSAKKNPNQIDHLGRERIEILNHALLSRSITYIKICKEHYYLFKISKNGENVGKILFKMVVNVEKLLKMVIFQNLSKNGEMLKNVGENI